MYKRETANKHKTIKQQQQKKSTVHQREKMLTVINEIQHQNEVEVTIQRT